MYNTDMPTRAELPTTKQLIRSTIIAIAAALAILVSVILPAEYAIDPIGVGKILGLTEMGEIKTQLAQEAAEDEAKAKATQQVNAITTTNQTVNATVPAATQPQQAKVETAPAATVVAIAKVEEITPAEEAAPTNADAQSETPTQQQWKDSIMISLEPGQGAEVKLVMEQGQVAQFTWTSNGGGVNFDTHGDGFGRSISYEKGRGVAKDEGELTAAFTGDHGWFFRNRNDNKVMVILKTHGDYSKMKRVL
ncbi:transmembrane anchor protein [Motilimonas sp. KMU-193]|uniref:transmembrane anchor protein n=1 Tax=Motilimonas sp. KMU-193 TaxID=3388668 RepID=UPI00396AFEC0